MNQLSPEARRLFSLARSVDEPQAEVLRRVETSLVARIGHGAAIVSTTTLTGKAAASLVATMPWAKLLLVAGTVAASVGGAGFWRMHAVADLPRPPQAMATQSRPVVAEPALRSASATPESAAPERPADLAVAPAATVEPPVITQNGRHWRPPVVESAGPPPVQDDPLHAEIRELRSAQQALRAGNGARVLALLSEQDITYARGAMQEERAAARVLALCQLGQVHQARATAQRFEKRWPKSSLLARLKNSCWRP